jgi:exonuclease SbcD
MNHEFSPLRLLHTSDWHIGRTLYGRKRYEEFEAFLTWLAETIQQNQINALLVAGDVFDTSSPSNRAQELYYRFLCRVAASSCRHIVVVAGNHDSPSFLNAPRELLKALDVHVVGSSTASPEDEVLVLRNEQDAPELIVCAVPYLRDRDIRVAEAGESVEDKERKLIDGIRTHYAAVAALAEQKREELGVDIPIVGTGHLFTAGGQTVDGDGVRELYVGSLAHVTAGIFPACFNYLALGHLHVPQKVNGSETIRYSGSPLPMGFGEAKQKKSVCQVEFHSTAASVQLIDVPIFHKMIHGHPNGNQDLEADYTALVEFIQQYG